MQSRFGLKDLAVLVLLAAILVSLWLAMKQFDRQWERVSAIREELRNITAEQAEMRQALFDLEDAVGRGVVAAGPDRPVAGERDADEEAYDPFARLRAAAEHEDFARGDWAIDAFGTKVKSLTPLVTTDAYGRAIQGYVLESLVTIDPETLETVPQLAESWTIEDNKAAWQAYVDARLADPLTEEEVRAETGFPEDAGEQEQADYIAQRIEEGRRVDAVAREAQAPPAAVITFTIRRRAAFSDGEPVTADDVVFTFDLMNDPTVNAPSIRQFYSNIRSCETVDARTVRFEMAEPHYLALSFCGGRSVLPQHFYERYGADGVNRNPGLLMGSGPYRLVSYDTWRPGQPLELVRNERYWGPVRPAFEKLVWREIEQEVPRLTAFRNGEIDILAPTPEQYVALLDDEQVMERAEAYAFDAVPSGYSYIAWNQVKDGEPSRFADRRVREAMTYLTPRQRIADDLFLGYAQPATGPFAPGSPQRDDSLLPRPYDVERGLALLEEAGYADRDGDGVVEDSAGDAFRFRLTYPSGSGTYERMVLYLRDAYAEAGIVMSPDPLEFSVMLERLDNQDFDAITLAWGGGAVEGDLRQAFHSSQSNKGGDNFMNYRSPELDALIDRARTTLDEDRRMPLWQEAHRVLYRDQPYTFMLNRKSLRVIDDRFENVQRVTRGLNERTEWFTPAAQQKW